DHTMRVAEQLVGGDLVVVVGRVGEGAAAIAIAERPDAFDLGAQGVVDCYEATLVEPQVGVLDAEVVGVRAAADGEQQVAAFEPFGLVATLRANGNRSGTSFAFEAIGVGADRDAL